MEKSKMPDMTENKSNGEMDKDEVLEEHIESLAPAMPGWYACYEDNDTSSFTLYTIAAFGIVTYTFVDGRKERIVRPFATAPDGIIGDVHSFPGFICVSGPGQDPRTVVAQMQEEQKEQPSRIIT